MERALGQELLSQALLADLDGRLQLERHNLPASSQQALWELPQSQWWPSAVQAPLISLLRIL
jgi:hypothetical protein